MDKKVQKKDILIVVLAFLQLIVSFFTDLFIRKINFIQWNSITDIFILIFNKIIAFILYLLFWKMIFYIKDKVKSKDKKTCSFLQSFIFYFTFNIILLLLTWPGIWRYDECKILACASFYTLEYWQHYITSIFYSISLMFIPIPSGVIIAQMAVIAMIVAYIISEFKQIVNNKKLVYLLYIPFFLLPILDTNLYPLRLSIYTYIELLFVCQLILMNHKQFATKKDIALLLITMILLSVWRSEGILFLILIPIICIVFLKKSIKERKYRFLLTGITILISLILILPQEMNYRIESSNKYEMTSFIDQLQVVVKKEIENGQMEEETRQKIEKVIDIDEFLKYRRGIYANNYGNLYKEYTQEDYKELKKIYKELLVKYPIDVLKERLNLLLETSGFKNDINVHVDNTRVIYKRPANLALHEFRTIYKSTSPISLNLRNGVINILEGWNISAEQCDTNISFNIFYNVIPSIIIVTVLCIISLFKKKWISLFIFGIILLKAIAIILTAPDTFFMYYLPIYLVGYFMLMLAIVLKIDKNKEIKILV